MQIKNKYVPLHQENKQILNNLKIYIMTATVNTSARIEAFLNSLDAKIEINDNLINYVDIEEIDFSDAFNSIYEMIDENNGFDIEVIYYANAIKYLQENDPSLNESLEIAEEYGYELKNLNSEVLASLLASRNAREDFSELSEEIEDFFAELEEEDEEEED